MRYICEDKSKPVHRIMVSGKKVFEFDMHSGWVVEEVELKDGVRPEDIDEITIKIRKGRKA